MANKNVKADGDTALKARLGKKQKSKPGNIQEVLSLVWDALKTAHSLLNEEDSVMKLKAVHGVTQAAQGYAKLWEVGELEARVAALENNQTILKGGNHEQHHQTN